MKHKQGKSVEKKALPKSELLKLVAKQSEYPKHVVEDILETYYDVMFDCLVDNYEVYLPGIGRLWIAEPRERRYRDSMTGEMKQTITFPVMKFKAIKRIKDSLKGKVYAEYKKAYRERLEAEQQAQEDKEFDKVFKTKPHNQVKNSEDPQN